MNASRGALTLAAALSAVLMVGAGCANGSASLQTNTGARPGTAGTDKNSLPAVQVEVTGGNGAAVNGSVAVNVAPKPPSSVDQGFDGAPTPAVHEIQMTAKKWEFSPSRVMVKQGEKVRLLITSLDVTHGFIAPDLSLAGSLASGTTSAIEFTADKKGTFDFRCSVFCGSGHADMRGVIVVE